MSARVREAGDDLLALSDKFFDVIVKIGKRGADFAHVLFELLDAFHGSADRAAEDNSGRNEFFQSCHAPCIPKLRVISANQGFVVQHWQNPFAQTGFSRRRTQRPIWAAPPEQKPKIAACSKPTI